MLNSPTRRRPSLLDLGLDAVAEALHSVRTVPRPRIDEALADPGTEALLGPRLPPEPDAPPELLERRAAVVGHAEHARPTVRRLGALAEVREPSEGHQREAHVDLGLEEVRVL